MTNVRGQNEFRLSPGDVTGRVEGLNNLKSESSGCSRPVCDGPTLEVCCRMGWTGELDISEVDRLIPIPLPQTKSVRAYFAEITGIGKTKVVSLCKPQDSLAGDPLSMRL